MFASEIPSWKIFFEKKKLVLYIPLLNLRKLVNTLFLSCIFPVSPVQLLNLDGPLRTFWMTYDLISEG